MDDIADPIQPDNGQGGEGGDSPYADYLNRIPEEARSEVEPVFKDWDANVTKKFQEAADYKRGWEPFEQLGVNQRDPSEVEWGMQFVDALKDPNAIKQWYDQYAQENGLAGQTPDVNGSDEYVDPQVAELRQQLQQLQGALAPQLAELTEWRSTQDRQAAEAQANAQREQALEAIRGKDDFNETLVTSLIPKYQQSDPEHAVQRAYADSQAIQSQIVKNWTEEKASQRPGAQSGGVADGAPEPINSLQEANRMALEQLRAGRG